VAHCGGRWRSRQMKGAYWDEEGGDVGVHGRKQCLERQIPGKRDDRRGGRGVTRKSIRVREPGGGQHQAIDIPI